MPNPIIYYRAFYDQIVFIDGFQNQFTYLSWTDTLDTLIDQFDHQYQDYALRDQLFFVDSFHVTPLNVTLTDSLSLTQSFRNIKSTSFTDVIELVEVWNPASLEDTVILTDNFNFIRVSTFEDDLSVLWQDEFLVHGTFSNQFTDVLELESIFVYYIMPTNTHCP
jgi:hypothetical protein